MSKRILTITVAMSVLAAGHAAAPHSQAQFVLDTTRMETISGTVAPFDFSLSGVAAGRWLDRALGARGDVDAEPDPPRLEP